MPFLKQSYTSFASPKLQEAKQFSKIQSTNYHYTLMYSSYNLSLNPLTTTRRYTVTHFCRFFTVLEYSPIGVKFSPTTAPRTLYTVKKKSFENFQNFFSFESFSRHKYFFMKKTYFDIFKKIYNEHFSVFFYYRNLIRGHLVTT